jgi:hypothetical protein
LEIGKSMISKPIMLQIPFGAFPIMTGKVAVGVGHELSPAFLQRSARWASGVEQTLLR